MMSVTWIIIRSPGAARVSVLDLDNSVRFSRDIQNLARKHQITNLLSEDRTELRSRPYSARSNSVDCYFELELKVTVSLLTM